MFKKILDFSERHGFLKICKNGQIGVGPTGALLQENLRNEWFYSMVINRDISVFFCKDSFINTYEYAKDICQKRAPFGIAEIVDDITDEFDFDKHCLNKPTFLKTTVFVSPPASTQFFHQWQRQRRTWWRKFSASPGKYCFSDLHTDDAGNQRLDIKAEYEWGKPLVEALRFHKSTHPQLTTDDLHIKDGHKKLQAHFITSTISFSSILLNSICDAYDEPEFQDKPRPLLRLHRKLAPYKISFAISATQTSTNEELNLLALYICKQLRNDHISSLLLPSAIKNSLESQWSHYDQLGVPYTILLNESTLKNGICWLRSRDTTLKEQIHVTKLPTYVQQLFKNY